MTVAPERTHAYVTDRLAIQDLVFRYNQALDTADEALFASLWAPGAGWHFPVETSGDGLGHLDGGDAILAAFRAFASQGRTTHHLTTNLVATIDGDHATGRSKAYTSGRLRPSIAGYADTYVRVAGQWRFARRTVTPYLH